MGCGKVSEFLSHTWYRSWPAVSFSWSKPRDPIVYCHGPPCSCRDSESFLMTEGETTPVFIRQETGAKRVGDQQVRGTNV